MYSSETEDYPQFSAFIVSGDILQRVAPQQRNAIHTREDA